MQKNLYILYIFVLAALVSAYIYWDGRDNYSNHAMMNTLSHNELKITDAYARAASPTAKSGAIFFVIENGTAEVAHLTSAESDIARRVELHTHKASDDGVMSMVEIEGGVHAKPGKRTLFQRGGNHVMLMGLNKSLASGDTFDLTLTFDGKPINLTVTVDNERKAKMNH